MKNVQTLLTMNVLVSLGLPAAASSADARIHKKILGSRLHGTTLILSNEEMRGITKTVKSLKDSCLLIKGVIQTIENETRRTKRRIPWYAIRYIR